MEWYESDIKPACLSCGANLGHLNGCIWDEDQAMKTNVSNKPNLSREEIMELVLKEFFQLHKGIKK